MPITHDVEVKKNSDDEFQELDYEVTRLAFSIHRNMEDFGMRRFIRTIGVSL